MSKCIKCGRELTSGEIPEFNYGMCDKCYKDYQCKQYPFKKGMFDMQDEIKQLKQQLAEKDKEIERLKVFEKAYYYNQLQASQEDIQKFQQLANQSAVNINHIAITELEKVKNFVKNANGIIGFDWRIDRFKVIETINNQIKILKGE